MARGGEVTWNDFGLAEFRAQVSDEALHEVGENTLDDARALAPRRRPTTKPPGRGSYPREGPLYLASHLGSTYDTSPEGFDRVRIGGTTPAAVVLTRYRAGAGGEGAYGGTRRRVTFLLDALELQRGRPII